MFSMPALMVTGTNPLVDTYPAGAVTAKIVHNKPHKWYGTSAGVQRCFLLAFFEFNFDFATFILHVWVGGYL